MEQFLGFTKELGHNQPNVIIGAGLAILVSFMNLYKITRDI